MLEELRRDLPRAQGPVRHGGQQGQQQARTAEIRMVFRLSTSTSTPVVHESTLPMRASSISPKKAR
jgi:hypothetical protein